MTEIVFLVVDLATRLAALLFLIRFVLQASGADFYNPISQAIVKGSDPLAKPLRSILPKSGRFDLASLILAWLTGIAFVAIVTMGSLSIGQYLTFGLVRALSVLISFYWWSLLIIVVASFVSQGNYHPALTLLEQLLEPIMSPIRKIMPTLGPLDLSPMVAILLLTIAERALAVSF